MKKWIVVAFAVLTMTKLSAQPINIQSLVDSLQYMQSDTFDCSADIYWRIIAQGDKAIRSLIEKLTDTTPTRVKSQCKSTRLNVGEIAWFALNDIGEFSVFAITHIQFCVIYGNGCWSFYDYLFENANKVSIQDHVRKWYTLNRTKFKKKRISKRNACQLRYNIRNYFSWSS